MLCSVMRWCPWWCCSCCSCCWCCHDTAAKHELSRALHSWRTQYERVKLTCRTHNFRATAWNYYCTATTRLYTSWYWEPPSSRALTVMQQWRDALSGGWVQCHANNSVIRIHQFHWNADYNISTPRWAAVLTVLWIGFCLTGPISLCLDSFVFMFVFFCVILSYCICVVLL